MKKKRVPVETTPASRARAASDWIKFSGAAAALTVDVNASVGIDLTQKDDVDLERTVATAFQQICIDYGFNDLAEQVATMIPLLALSDDTHGEE